MNIDLSLNRVYWEYYQTRTHLRPLENYFCSPMIPSLGCKVNVPEYKTRSKSFHNDLLGLVKLFNKKYGADYKFCLALSGGIDSEVTAEAFYELGIPFRAISLRLFSGYNDHDIVYATKYCRDRNIDHKIYNLTKNRYIEETIPDAIKHGQFTHAYSQIALTHLFKHVDDGEIAVFSGHNPDFHTKLGVGWWEDSPNMVKYAISKNLKFFTFTSLEPIFCHYAANFDGNQPGEKNNDFLYDAFPHLIRRVKMTGWEKSDKIVGQLIEIIRAENNHAYQTFITWEKYTLNYLRHIIQKNPNAYKEYFYHE